MSEVVPYPKSGPLGGTLIRKVISFLKSQQLCLPISSHILIAISGGIDSVGLAHLIVHFGRRIVPREKITLLHINHGWRGKESDEDEEWVKSLAAQWGVPIEVKRLSGPPQNGDSWEESARNARQKIFRELAQNNPLIFTAHQADDLAETLLWRLCTGTAETHGGGISFRHGSEIRPFLKIRKNEILHYLQEVGQSYREDSTNQSQRFLRAKMRSSLMPELERIFPRAVEHLGAVALKAQTQIAEFPDKEEELLLKWVIGAAGLKARRAHFALIHEKLEKLVANESWSGEIHLPNNWKLIRERSNQKDHLFDLSQQSVSKSSERISNEGVSRKEWISERWILEKVEHSRD